MIFPIIRSEEKVRAEDKTRIDATESFVSPDESSISLVEIEPESGAGFIDVTSNKYLDWSYSTSGTKTVTLRITTNGSPEAKTANIEVVDSADDILFSDDNDLVKWEPTILRFVEKGRNSFLNIHRNSRDRILDTLDERKIFDSSNDPIKLENLARKADFKFWSIFLTLQTIFEGVSNQIDDIFAQKAIKYEEKAIAASERGIFRLDVDADGEEDVRQDNKTYRLRRR